MKKDDIVDVAKGMEKDLSPVTEKVENAVQGIKKKKKPPLWRRILKLIFKK